eukprot:m.208493 g.208493  ORF g.208493 m.208493 type:complete len:371 (-) comp26086_c0_seq1:4750-5862(-)
MSNLVIYDTDPGIDDFLAGMLLLSCKRVKVLGMTIVMGNNNNLDILARNACLMLDLAGQSNTTKVVKGADKPLLNEYTGFAGIKVHGANGLGNIEPPFAPSEQPLKHEFKNAAEYLVSTCAKFPGQVTIIAVGPLTNIATACLCSKSFPQTVKKLVIMGGALNMRGNVTPTAEANVHNDPEAAKIVFDSFPEIVMAGLDITRKIPMSPEFRQRIRQTGPVGSFMYEITQHYVDLLRSWGSKVVCMHDACAVMYFLHPELFETEHVCVDVETQGKLTRGVTVADWRGHWKRKPQTHMLKDASAEKFHDLFIEYITSAFGSAPLAKKQESQAPQPSTSGNPSTRGQSHSSSQPSALQNPEVSKEVLSLLDPD